MILGSKSIRETHYDVLSVKEDASYDEIRTNYRNAILNSHPYKLNSDYESGERFLRVQKAWEIFSDPNSQTIYDRELRDSRQSMLVKSWSFITSAASVVLPCGSCSLLVRLMINSDIKVPIAGYL
ncbi:hypothetical protein like AT4G10130 [Hibiscus trionum]|uniref:J domain-containing protein n=1 Tax=Hibiscus trionum TaxID=183268 RepID=A0A9W7JBM6_HIBTR|nr:hypothetical protein like AT4G10130 [Hibiscus trionum]